jgi:hypothetical protein
MTIGNVTEIFHKEGKLERTNRIVQVKIKKKIVTRERTNKREMKNFPLLLIITKIIIVFRVIGPTISCVLQKTRG